MRRTGHVGFTLMELLVVIAIVAILASLIVPAIQRGRAAAARTQCSNNLRQLGLAAHAYHDSARRFPAGMSLQKGKSPYRLSSWLTHLLPYVEQAGLWQQTQQAYRATNRPF